MSSNNDLSTKKLTGSRELLSGDASQKNRDADKKYNLGAAETVQRNLKQSLQSLNMNSDDEDAREVTARNDDFPPDQDVMDAYQQRVATVLQNRYQRTLQHLSNFMRVMVSLSVDGGAVKQIPIVVERTKSIELLARQIEAEYAYMHMEETINRTADDESNLIMSLHVVMIYDIGDVPLKFSSTIHEVLNSGDSVQVVAVNIGNGATSRHASSIKQRVDNMLNFLQSRSTPESKLPEKCKNSETILFRTLHNLMGVGYFQEFCMAEYEIENLIFWLEIEVFRGIAQQSLDESGRSFSSPTDNTLIGLFDPKFPSLLLHSRYIYYTFLAPSATLRLNLPVDLLSSLPWPLPRIDPISGLHLPLDPKMYDDIQEHVFFYLSHYVLPKFQNCPAYAALKEAQESNNEEYSESWILPGDHYKKYHQDAEGMEKAIAQVLSTVISKGDLADNTINSKQASKSYYGVPYIRVPTSHTKDIIPRAISDGTLSKSSVMASGIVDPSAYYGDGPRITNAQKIRRITREKRLKKFFGDIPVQDDEYIDAKRTGFASISLQDDIASIETSSDVPISATPTTEAVEPQQLAKKKKAAKLEEFFGVPRLPAEQLFEQKLVDTMKLVDEDAESTRSASGPAILTRNELAPDAKRRMMQRNKKLKFMLGQSLDESVVGSMAVPVPVAAETASVRVDSETTSEKGSHTEDDEQVFRSPSAQRRASHLSVASAESMTSLTSVTEKVRRLRHERDYRRKKTEKIQQFLGERVTARMLGQEAENGTTPAPAAVQYKTPLNVKERQVYLRRINKLQGMLGDVPPSSIIVDGHIAPSDTAMTGEDSSSVLNPLGEQGEQLLQYLLLNEPDIADLIAMMEDFDRREGISEEDQVESIEEAQVPTNLANRVQQEQRRQRQRKRIGKLTRFFGSPAGPISTELATEDKMIFELGRHLKDMVDPEVWTRISAAHAQKANDNLGTKKNSVTSVTKGVAHLDAEQLVVPGIAKTSRNNVQGAGKRL